MLFYTLKRGPDKSPTSLTAIMITIMNYYCFIKVNNTLEIKKLMMSRSFHFKIGHKVFVKCLIKFVELGKYLT